MFVHSHGALNSKVEIDSMEMRLRKICEFCSAAAILGEEGGKVQCSMGFQSFK